MTSPRHFAMSNSALLCDIFECQFMGEFHTNHSQLYTVQARVIKIAQVLPKLWSHTSWILLDSI